MKKGFTLVELSIVLVIIGLLIGGILSAQSMIQTAKVNSLVKKLQQYEIAISNFKTTFGHVPGDAPSFTPPGNGNGNNTDDDGAPCRLTPGDGAYSGQERRFVWAHLSQGGMLAENYEAYSPIACGGTHPAIYDNSVALTQPIFNESALFISGLGLATNKIGAWYYDFGEVLVNGSTKPYHANYATPLEVMALDSKLDNGDTGSGTFTAYVAVASALPVGVILNDNCSDFISEGGNNSSGLCGFRWYANGL